MTELRNRMEETGYVLLLRTTHLLLTKPRQATSSCLSYDVPRNTIVA